MRAMRYTWQANGAEHELRLVAVPGTNGYPYSFGHASRSIPVEVADFAIMATPVTQALWHHVMGSNPAVRPDPLAPVENVSWDDISAPSGFIARLNTSAAHESVVGPDATLRFRLPTESEWEYAARGGPHWRNGFAFSGSHDPDEVAWYGRRFSSARRLLCRMLGWRLGWRLTGAGNRHRPTRTHPVASKAPNQLGLFDMSGNVWEWCEDVCTDDPDAVPRDGSACTGPGEGRRLRGGCHHNWDIHCTVWWRYGIAPDAHDGCIGFRLVLAPHPQSA